MPSANAGSPGEKTFTGVDSPYTIEVVSELADVLALRQDWDRMSRYADSDLDFFLKVSETQAGFVRLHVLVAKRAGSVRAILAARIEKRPLILAIGYKKIGSPPLRFLTTAMGGLLGEVDGESARLLLKALQGTLSRREVDVVDLNGIDAGNDFTVMMKNAGTALTRDAFPSTLRRLRVQLPSTYEQLLRSRSSNTRRNEKRYSKRFAETFDSVYAIRTFRNPEDVEQMLTDIEAVARKTYHRGLGVGFINNEQTREISLLCARKGWLRAHVLYVRGVPCAFWTGWHYRRTFYTWTTGYDPTFQETRPGLFLLGFLFRELCAEGNTDIVDFGNGDAQYKRDWCDHEQVQVSQLLFAPTIKTVCINTVRMCVISGTDRIRNILARTDLIAKLKKRLRTHSTSAPSG